MNMGWRRLRAFNLGQRLLARRDNALPVRRSGGRVRARPLRPAVRRAGRRRHRRKAWINRTLENNPAPALWLTNDANSMNRAYLRRFDYAIRFTLPPQSVRMRSPATISATGAGRTTGCAHRRPRTSDSGATGTGRQAGAARRQRRSEGEPGAGAASPRWLGDPSAAEAGAGAQRRTDRL